MTRELPAKTKNASTFKGGDDDETATVGAHTPDERDDEVVLVDLESLQRIHSAKEFEHQLLSLISSKGFEASKLVKYSVENSDTERINFELLALLSKVTDVPRKLNWKDKTEKRTKTQDPSTTTGKTEIECDLYLQLTDMDSEKLSVLSLLREMGTAEIVPINTEETSSIILSDRDWIWMEIAETPECLKNKMNRLECAYRHFKKQGKEDLIPKCVVICLNGEKGKFKTAANYIQGLYEDGELENWNILSNGIPCLVTYTPYLNVYDTLYGLKEDMDSKFKMTSAFKRMEFKSDSTNMMLALTLGTVVIGTVVIPLLTKKK